jgi:hypothetical protein
MATNFDDVILDEAVDFQVDFIAPVRGESNVILSACELGPAYATVQWENDGSTITAVVPWSNIKSINQVV